MKSLETTVLIIENKKKRSTKLVITLSIFLILIIAMVIMLILIVTDNTNETSNDSQSMDSESHTFQPSSGVFGKFSSHGGNPRNQQIAADNTIINKNNVKDLNLLCTHIGGSTAYSGYITVDDEDRGYATDGAGAVFKIDLNTCTQIWSINVADLLGYNSKRNEIFRNRQTVTLFINSNGDKGVLLGTPSSGRSGISPLDPCWAVALSTNDGSLLWKTNLGGTKKNWNCLVHGFMVDENDHFAYGGITVSQSRSGLNFEAVVRGRMVKLDIDNGAIIDIFYSIDNDKFGFDDDTVNVLDPYYYRGASFWNMEAIIGDYVIAGTGNMLTYPKYIEDCLLLDTNIGNLELYNEYVPIEDANPMDPCGNDRSSMEHFHPFWRCLEKGVYPSSFIILNKNTFELESAIPLQGIDTEDTKCRNGYVSGCMRVQGPDSDLAAVAGYTDPRDGKLYGVAAQKSGSFFVFAIPSGETIIAKKVGPWSFSGGSQWSVAVDEDNLIAIVTITGGNSRSGQQYKTVLANGEQVCDRTGSVHAINLTNSDTIWQMYNPWGTIGELNCDKQVYDNYVDYAATMQCETDNVKDPSETVIDGNVVTAPIDESERDDISSSTPQMFVAPVMIVGDMVFVPAYSGDIFIHNLFNGQYIHTLKCPKRSEIKGGITVVDDRVLFYCGSTTIVSMKLT